MFNLKLSWGAGGAGRQLSFMGPGAERGRGRHRVQLSYFKTLPRGENTSFGKQNKFMFRFVLLKKLWGMEKNEDKRTGGRRDKEKLGSLKKLFLRQSHSF